jgi:hypothetical protein
MSLVEAFQKYPDVHRSIIIKTELLRVGLRFTEQAIQGLRSVQTVFKGYHLFSYDRQKVATVQDQIPQDIYIKKDETMIQVRTNLESPYFIDMIEDRFYVTENGQPVEEIYFRSPPEYYSKKLGDGTPMGAVAQSIGDSLFVTFNKICEMWNDGNQCLFCDFNRQTEEQLKRGEEQQTRKDPSVVAEVLWVGLEEERHRHIFMSGGTILVSLFGKGQVEYYCDFLNTIQRKLRVWYPAIFQIGALDEDNVKRLYDTGVGSLQPNIEVLDRKLFKIICPGKEKYVGYDEWIRRMINAAKVFGPGRIVTNLVSGIEMAKPFGFTRIEDALRSTLEGCKFLLDHGIFPRFDLWCVEPYSALGGQEPPPLEYYIELGRRYKELRDQYDFHNRIIGMCRGCCHIDTIYDWDYFSPRR